MHKIGELKITKFTGFFKYLMKRQFNMVVYCISKVLKLIILSPVVFFSIFQKIFSEIVSRIKLLLAFKTILR